MKGPLTTEEIEQQSLFWIKRAQENCDIEEDQLRLNLQVNQQDVLECRGRIQGEYPVYLPDTPIHSETGGRCSPSNSPWGSGADDGTREGSLLGPKAATANP